MPESTLYMNALRSLGPQQAAWLRVAQAMSKVSGPDIANQDGGTTLRRIQEEEQLSADPSRAEPARMLEILNDLAGQSWPDSTNARSFAELHEKVLSNWQGMGPPVKMPPATLYRYFNGTGFLKFKLLPVIKRSLSADRADWLDTVFAECRRPDRDVVPETLVQAVRDAAPWDAWSRGEVPLYRFSHAFVTFDAPDPPDRGSAAWIHSALALWKPLDTCFIEVRFETPPSAPLRLPTFADAGWFRHFRGVVAGEAHGWTSPHDPSLPRQPEAVMERPHLGLASRPADLRVLPP